MSPAPFSSNYHIHDQPLVVKREDVTSVPPLNNNIGGHIPRTCPPTSLKVHKDSHTIKKSSSSSHLGLGPKPQQRGPVIIYTHSPKVIHTNPKDFMALVQKLTGMNRSEGAMRPTNNESEPRSKNPNSVHGATQMLRNDYGDIYNDIDKFINITCHNNSNNNNNSNSISNSNEDNESSSVITDENCSSSTNTRDGVVAQLNAYGVPPLPNSQSLASTASPLLPDLSFYNMAGCSELYSGVDQPVYDYMDVNFPYNHTN